MNIKLCETLRIPNLFGAAPSAVKNQFTLRRKEDRRVHCSFDINFYNLLEKNIPMKYKHSTNKTLSLFTFGVAIITMHIVTTPLYAQQASNVKTYFEAVRNNNRLAENDNWYKNNRKIERTWKDATTFLSDSTDKIRLEAYGLIYNASRLHSEVDFRQKGVMQLVQGLKDKDLRIQQYIAERLNEFNTSDYSFDAKAQLLGHLSASPLPDKNLVLIAGYLGGADAVAVIRQVASGQTAQELKLSCWFALARSGDTQSINRLYSMISKNEMNDQLVYYLVPGLLYTRQKALYDAVIKAVYSDEKNCTTPNPDEERPVICAYRLIEQLSPYIKDYPYPLNAAGDLNTKSYKKALSDIRTWLTTNKDSYQIIDESY
ncbi:MAG: hypothetical protein MI922_16495 [Bacteroidales bacterium]|nr:hypothetical protein [Bacteroidales bacterium]